MLTGIGSAFILATMTKLAVSLLVESLSAAHAQAAQAAERGADLVEYRIDLFTEELTALKALVERSPLPCILTCRPEWEGGEYSGDEESRRAVLVAAAEAGPAYLDIELAAWTGDPELRRRLEPLLDGPKAVTPSSVGLILSTHDFQTRPADLLQRVEAMAATATARVAKLAYRARSLRDNIECFELLLAQHKPTVAIAMGEYGLASRVLAKKFGALLSFVGLDDRAVTAPGQVGLETMKSLYRWDRLRADTSVYGVIGWPVAHSMSPAIHNAGFDAVGYNGVYLPMPIPPEYEHFKATVGDWLNHAPLNFRGASVTIPHKENLIRYVKEVGGEVEPLSEAIGAANTLTVRDDGSLYASNTDYAAAIDAVVEAMEISREQVADKRVAVIGAGGAARAIVAGFAGYGASVVVYNRTMERAAQLAEEFSNRPIVPGITPGDVTAAPLDELSDSYCNIYINCTPLGMHPHVDATPMPELANTRGVVDAAMGSGPIVVFDTIYNPIRTRLIRDAEALSCHTISGIQMFVRQGAAQFTAWTGLPAPEDVFEKILRDRLTQTKTNESNK